MDDDLECPYCGGVAIVVSEKPSSVPWNDGDSDEIICECCKRKLNVVCEVKRIEWKFVDDNWDEIEFED